MPGWPVALARVVTVRWSSFLSLASRHGPGRPAGGSLICHFLCPSRSESHRQRRQVERGVRGPTRRYRQLEVTAVRHRRVRYGPIIIGILEPVVRRACAGTGPALLEVVVPGWPGCGPGECFRVVTVHGTFEFFYPSQPETPLSESARDSPSLSRSLPEYRDKSRPDHNLARCQD